MLRRARIKAGDTVLVVGIGSGVSCAALALAKHLGAEVVATSRSEAKREQAMAMGAVAAIDSAADAWPVQADIVIESVGEATWDKSVRALKAGGRLVVCGGTSGAERHVNLPRLFFKQFEIIGSSMGSYQEFAELTALVDEGLDVQVDQVLPLDELPGRPRPDGRRRAARQDRPPALTDVLAFVQPALRSSRRCTNAAQRVIPGGGDGRLLECSAVAAYVPEEFTPDEADVLRRYFTNLDGPVFALVNLPEVVKGALFARYSRSAKSLRRLFLDEFVGDLDISRRPDDRRHRRRAARRGRSTRRSSSSTATTPSPSSAASTWPASRRRTSSPRCSSGAG